MRGYEDLPIDYAPVAQWWDADGVAHQTLHFIVPGKPIPKGNVIKSSWGGYHDATKGLPDWMALCESQALAAMKGQWRIRQAKADIPAEAMQLAASLDIIAGAVTVDVTFVMYRPKTTMIDGKRWDLTKIPTPPYTKKPDADKLFRAIGDAMTGIIFIDDGQANAIGARKRYAELGETPGAIINVSWVA